jgi:MSHA biogenesis protein MshG
VTITQALTQLAKSTRSKLLKAALIHMVESILAGQTLTQAMQKHSHIFSGMVINVIDAGENSGQLETAFLQLAKYLELESQTIKRVKSATRYPLIVIVALVVAFCVINFMVVPVFANMFRAFGSQLPIVTRAMIVISDFMLAYWPYLLVIVVLLFFLFRFSVSRPQGAIRWAKFKIKVPIVGPILYRIGLARFARMFCMIMQSGVPLVKGITLVAQTLGNAYMRQQVLVMREGIEKGDSLTRSASDSKLFSPMVLQMIQVGEETGEIDELLANMAEYYEREVDYDLGRLGDLIEPILLAVIGVLVLFLAMGVFLPMWDMVSFVRH